MVPTPTDRLTLRIKSVTYETADIRVYELRSPEGIELPQFTAGAHIDLHLENGLVRSYSMVNGEHERSRYVIGVAKEKKSRGGSRYIHETVVAGNLVSTSFPKNNFSLDENAHETVLIAGGVGITPIMSMLHRLHSLKHEWSLYFATRNRELTPFLEDLEKYGERIHLHCDEEHGGRFLGIDNIVASAGPGAHFYCCGPNPMLESFRVATRGLAPAHVHVEHFSALETAATQGGFQIELARSGTLIFVGHGKTILDAVLEAGIDVPYSCQAGVCGTCEVKVLSGVPDHRDLVLSDSERSWNKSMMICCSGSKSAKLVLDL